MIVGDSKSNHITNNAHVHQMNHQKTCKHQENQEWKPSCRRSNSFPKKKDETLQRKSALPKPRESYQAETFKKEVNQSNEKEPKLFIKPGLERSRLAAFDVGRDPPVKTT